MSSIETIECDDISDIVEKVFSKPPSPPNSYRIELIDYTPDTALQTFRTLGQILTHGIVYLYGNENENVNISDLTITQLKTIQDYMKSFGWVVIVNPKSYSDHPNALPHMLKIPNKETNVYVQLIFEPLYR